MAPHIIKIGKFRLRGKMAIFDYDWTLVKPLSNGTFSKSVDDWRWLTEKVPEILEDYYKKGYCIVIISNQTRNTEMKLQQIINVLSTLKIPSLVSVGYEDIDKKPNRTMFDLIKKDKKIDMNKSFYVGDALGRQGDWSDSDKKFAENIDIKKIYSPDDLFSIKNDKKLIIKEFDKQEIIVLVGYPGSGKTTIANTFDNKRYMTINGDIFKNSKNMIKESEKYIKSNYSIIFDATNPSIEKRKEYIDFAKSKNIPIRCINVETDIATSMFRNNKRDKVIPKITYYVFRKKYIKPTIEEGFYNVIDIS
jgi:bifunctional polynucleotide phosphatase/kinase